MPVTVKNISLWRKEVENKTGVLAQTLEPLAKAGADLHVVMGYRYPGDESKAVVELYPISVKSRLPPRSRQDSAPHPSRHFLSKGTTSQVWDVPLHRPLRMRASI